RRDQLLRERAVMEEAHAAERAGVARERALDVVEQPPRRRDHERRRPARTRRERLLQLRLEQAWIGGEPGGRALALHARSYGPRSSRFLDQIVPVLHVPAAAVDPVLVEPRIVVVVPLRLVAGAPERRVALALLAVELERPAQVELD